MGKIWVGFHQRRGKGVKRFEAKTTKKLKRVERKGGKKFKLFRLTL